ncbi:MAG: site-2 protease family protein [Sphingomonas sp.]|uniref:M50 family metallopeptidase n=1 Tax=Sphingomonas sp. TaxID=28214 RepID=UPI0017D28B46|nr:RIP metalloprotease RseP [Zymomonas sp.]MBA4772438.1 site-2 protease family protein [Sphingomonas sp.]
MIQSPGLLQTVLAFVLVIGPLVFLHELGHYLAGRVFGVKAEEFSIGFGRELFGVTDRRGTRWKFSLLPLGGFVKFAGDMDPSSRSDPGWLALPAEERAQTFQAKPLWQRAIIVAAGPVTNFAIALGILTAFVLAVGELKTSAVIGRVETGSPAQAAGLARGDRITALGERPVASFQDMLRYVQIRPGERVTIAFERDGRAQRVDATIATKIDVDRFGNQVKLGRLGIAMDASAARFEPVSPLTAPVVALSKIGDILGMMGEVIGQIFVGKRPVSELGGPLQIAKVSGEQFSLGLSSFVFFIALVSLNLAVINLLPVPVLDGGHLMFYAIEAVLRRPVSPQVMEWAFRGGLAAVLGLMLMVTFNDLGTFGLWTRLAGLIG